MVSIIKVHCRDKTNKIRNVEFSADEWKIIRELIYRPFKFYQEWQYKESDRQEYHYWSKLWDIVKIEASEYDLMDIPSFYFTAAIEGGIGRETSSIQDAKGNINYDLIENLNFLLKRIEQDDFNPRSSGNKKPDFFNYPSNYKGFDFSKITFSMDMEKNGNTR